MLSRDVYQNISCIINLDLSFKLTGISCAVEALADQQLAGSPPSILLIFRDQCQDKKIRAKVRLEDFEGFMKVLNTYPNDRHSDVASAISQGRAIGSFLKGFKEIVG